MQLSGDEVGALAIQRQREIDAVDASLRPLLERIHALQDEQSAAAAAAKVAEEAARVESQRASMEIEYYRALGRESVAVVLQRAAEIRAMDESLRPLQAKIWLLQDQAKIEAEAAALAHSRSQLLVQLLQAEGDAVGAVALQRRLELEAMDESLRPMQQMIYDLADAAAEAERLEEAARAAAEAEARLAEQRSGLQLRLLEALGDAEGALAMRREQELAAADASLRGLIGQIHAAEDAAKAAEALRQAQEEQARAAEAAAKAAEELARTRTSMEIELLRALGKETEALAAQRAMELAALDQSLHALQNQIYAAQDAAAAQAALAQEQAAAATEAERLAGIARTARGLQADILELEGDAIAATAVRRALELEAMDASLHPLQQRIYQLRDEAAAAEEAARAAEELAEQARRTAEAEAALARQRQGMEADILELEGKAAEAMAIRRALEMEALDASLHPLQIRIYQLRDEAAAAQEAARAADELAAQQRAAAELARTRIGMEAQILELQGDAAAALLIRRQLEIEAMDESLRPLQQLINSLTDARDAAEAAARAEADLAAAQAEIAGRRRALDIELLDAMGLAEEALAARRADELAALDESLRPLQQLIWQYRDAATEAEALARAQADAAAEAERLAQAEAQLAKQRQGLEAELLEALGRSVEAVALRRQMELAALDQSLHALQQQVWAAQDAAAANAELARQQAEAAEAAEEAARAAEALRKAGVDLHIRYFDLLGDSAAATALRRQEELAATDASLHALLRQIYALEDAKAAEDAYAQALQAKNSRVDDARKALSAAYDREAGALGRTIDQFTKFGDSLREFRAGLFLADTATAASYRQMQVRLIQTAALAATGDIAALGGLQGVSKDFLAASRAQSSTLAQYQRDVAFVARSVDAAIGASDEAVDYAQAQLAALDRLVGGYIDLNDNVLSVNQAIWQLKQTMAQEVVPQTVTPIVVSTERQTEAIDRGNAELKAEIAMLKQTLASLMTAVAENTGDLARIIRRMDGGDFLKVGSDPDTPVHVANADGKPLIVVEETP
jgi:hypothetical protein